MYGATSGKLFAAGQAGDRFAVRNSGAIAVVEGTGDHCCEYMTGGIIMVLGNTGVNFGAGMSGGIAYVYDNDKSFAKRCNTSMVEIIELNSENPSSSENLFNKQTYLENDEKRIREMLMRHINYTNSQVAKKLLRILVTKLKTL